MNLDAIYRCCNEDGGCLRWQGAKTSTGHPTIYAGGRHQLLKREIFKATKGRIQPGCVVVGAIRDHKCPIDCVNGEHLQAWTRSRLIAVARRETHTPYMNYVRARARTAKLDLAKAQEIRLLEGSAREIAERYGVSASLIGQIRRGEVWRAAAAGSSVFNLAANAGAFALRA